MALSPFLLPDFRTDDLNAILATTLSDLDDNAADRVQAHLANIGASGESSVAQGMERVTANGLDGCPFCAQSLDGSALIGRYRAYFGEAYAALKAQVARAIEDVERFHGTGSSGDFDSSAAFERAIRVTVERRQFWSRFAEIPEIVIDTAAIASARGEAQAAVLTALRSKQDRPLERMEFSREGVAALERYERLRQHISDLSFALQRANDTIAVVREQAASGNVAALTRDRDQLRAIKARYTPEIAPLCASYLDEKTAKTAAEQRRGAARTALNQYRQSIFPTYQTAINEYLRKFNAGFRIDQIAPQNTRGGPHAPTACSSTIQPSPWQPQLSADLLSAPRSARAIGTPLPSPSSLHRSTKTQRSRTRSSSSTTPSQVLTIIAPLPRCRNCGGLRSEHGRSLCFLTTNRFFAMFGTPPIKCHGRHSRSSVTALARHFELGT